MPTLDDGFLNVPLAFAEVVKLVDTPDSKSGASDRVPVRVRLSAPILTSRYNIKSRLKTNLVLKLIVILINIG